MRHKLLKNVFQQNVNQERKGSVEETANFPIPTFLFFLQQNSTSTGVLAMHTTSHCKAVLFTSPSCRYVPKFGSMSVIQSSTISKSPPIPPKDKLCYTFLPFPGAGMREWLQPCLIVQSTITLEDNKAAEEKKTSCSTSLYSLPHFWSVMYLNKAAIFGSFFVIAA